MIVLSMIDTEANVQQMKQKQRNPKNACRTKFESGLKQNKNAIEVFKCKEAKTNRKEKKRKKLLNHLE